MMNYFELFELPVSFLPDPAEVKKKYFALSRKFHPDHYVQQSEDEQRTALDTSALVNKAFKTFNNKDATIKYVLQLQALLEEEEKYNLSNDFLMEMMEVNEEADEVRNHPDSNKIDVLQKQLINLENEIYEPVAHIIENYKEGITTKEELLQVKDYYFKKKYLVRIKEALNGML